MVNSWNCLLQLLFYVSEYSYVWIIRFLVAVEDEQFVGFEDAIEPC